MASQKPTTVRLPDDIRRQIEELVQYSGRSFSSVVNEMLEEAVRMRRLPGIVFTDGPTGRRARVAGTGLDVFEIVATYRELDRDWSRLREAYDWLGEPQLRVALAYSEAYPEEIEERLAREHRWDGQTIGQQYPFTKP